MAVAVVVVVVAVADAAAANFESRANDANAVETEIEPSASRAGAAPFFADLEGVALTVDRGGESIPAAGVGAGGRSANFLNSCRTH